MRKLSNRGFRRKTGKFPSVKSGKMVLHEFGNELSYLYHLEHDREVLCYTHQPLTLHYKLNGKKRRYTPDYLVIMKNYEKHIKEVKPEKKVARYMEQFQLIEQILKEKGFIFSVVTDTFIKQEPRLYNLKFLHRYYRIPIRQEAIDAVNVYFGTIDGPVIIDEAKRALGQMGVLINEFYAMMYHGIIGFDMSSKIEDWSFVYIEKPNTAEPTKE